MLSVGSETSTSTSADSGIARRTAGLPERQSDEDDRGLAPISVLRLRAA